MDLSFATTPVPISYGIQYYVLGFLFSRESESAWVTLIRKSKPEWQKGLLNGIGGKIEEGETPQEAMSREFLEEAGVAIASPSWIPFCDMAGKGFAVYCFKRIDMKLYNSVLHLHNSDNEMIFKVSVKSLRNEKCVSNLHWLIPMALDTDRFYCSVDYDAFGFK